MPTGPVIPILFNALYENLAPIVQRFIHYYIKPLNVLPTLKGISFTGLLGATIFAGQYQLAGGGDVEKFFVTFNAVPGPEVGAGLSFLVVGVTFWIGYVLYRRRTIID